MKIQVKHKYLILPVNLNSSEKILILSKEDEPEYKLKIRLDNISPNFKAYIDVSRFIGQEISISSTPKMDIIFEESDAMDISSVYHEPERPQVHFTAKNGWINDPNGLIFVDGKYHLFYQYNPCEPRWNNMHWGHAISPDMIHWQETDIALFPDKTGAMFSGSAIVDEKNRLGLQAGDIPTVLLYYTATDPFSQYMAYSTDGLKTIQKTDTPVIPHIVGGNRDPKVVFCQEWDAYVMVLYLSEDTYAFFKSDDLIKWDLVQKISVPGENECPDLFPIVADDGERKWVFIGAHDRYVVGDMKSDEFCPVQEPQSLHYGISAYAGQTFSGIPDGRIVRIDWDRWNIPTQRFNGQMSFPTELTLKLVEGIYYLCALPIKEIKNLYTDGKTFHNLELYAHERKEIPLNKTPYVVKVEAQFDAATRLTLNIFGRKIECDTTKNNLTFSKSTAPLSLTPNKLELIIISDQCSVELYLDGGRYYIGNIDLSTYCDYNIPYMEIISDKNCELKYVELHSLKSIWE